MGVTAKYRMLPPARFTAGVFALLKWALAAQFCWLAWQLAQTRVSPGDATGPLPASAGGILLNLVNPASWLDALVLMKEFVMAGDPALQAAALIAICFLTFPTHREEGAGATTPMLFGGGKA